LRSRTSFADSNSVCEIPPFLAFLAFSACLPNFAYFPIPAVAISNEALVAPAFNACGVVSPSAKPSTTRPTDETGVPNRPGSAILPSCAALAPVAIFSRNVFSGGGAYPISGSGGIDANTFLLYLRMVACRLLILLYVHLGL
jgi:hypothetical protein